MLRGREGAAGSPSLAWVLCWILCLDSDCTGNLTEIRTILWVPIALLPLVAPPQKAYPSRMTL